VVADIAFLDDVGARGEGAFLGAAEQVGDLGRGQALEGLDVLGQLEQQAL
jgi:hypothetical protein